MFYNTIGNIMNYVNPTNNFSFILEGNTANEIIHMDKHGYYYKNTIIYCYQNASL